MGTSVTSAPSPSSKPNPKTQPPADSKSYWPGPFTYRRVALDFQKALRVRCAAHLKSFLKIKSDLPEICMYWFCTMHVEEFSVSEEAPFPHHRSNESPFKIIVVESRRGKNSYVKIAQTEITKIGMISDESQTEVGERRYKPVDFLNELVNTENNRKNAGAHVYKKGK